MSSIFNMTYFEIESKYKCDLHEVFKFMKQHNTTFLDAMKNAGGEYGKLRHDGSGLVHFDVAGRQLTILEIIDQLILPRLDYQPDKDTIQSFKNALYKSKGSGNIMPMIELLVNDHEYRGIRASVKEICDFLNLNFRNVRKSVMNGMSVISALELEDYKRGQESQ